MKLRTLFGGTAAGALLVLATFTPAQADCQASMDRVSVGDTIACYPPPCTTLRCR